MDCDNSGAKVKGDNCKIGGDEHIDIDVRDVSLKMCNMLDIYDPRNWNALDSKLRELLLINGPKRDISFKKGPKDKFHRRFSASLFTRVLPNGEMCDRSWLVYSKELDRVFCFCCKLLRKGNPRGLLVSDGFCDWQHVNFRLKEHETNRWKHVLVRIMCW